MKKNQTLALASLALASHMWLSGCAHDDLQTDQREQPMKPPVWQMKLCNNSDTNYSILSTVPPQALHAHSCLAAPFVAADFEKLQRGEAGAELPVLTLQGDDDPLNYAIDLLPLPTPFDAQYASGQMCLQVESDRNLYWVAAVPGSPALDHGPQPPKFPIAPTAD